MRTPPLCLVPKLPRRLRNLFAEQRSTWSFRKNCSSSGAWFSRHASIHGADGISLGLRSKVCAGAMIACGTLNTEFRFSAAPSGRVIVGNNCTIMPHAILATYGGQIVIGDNVSINPFTVIYGHGNIRIGSDTRIAAHCVVIPANHTFARPDELIRKQGLTQKGITIGSDVWIGAGARILDGVTIGDHAVVAAGCVVTKSVQRGEIVGGVPSRQLKYRHESFATAR